MSYFPSTLSELVHDPSDPGGKCFFCVELMGAIIIFMSSYPTMLRNVYVGDDFEVPYINISWTTFRHFVPAPGMMLLAIITTVPAARADTLDQFCIQLHMIGALMLFIVRPRRQAVGQTTRLAHAGSGVREHGEAGIPEILVMISHVVQVRPSEAD